MSGLLVQQVQPEYPEEAKQKKIEGDVVLDATIDECGRVVKLQAISGPKELAQAAVTVVKRWVYRPYLKSGQPMKVETKVLVRFTLFPGGSTSSARGPQWEEGVVDGRTYKNASLGLEIAPPATLQLGSPELRGNVGTVPLIVTVTSLSEPTVSGRDAMAFYADALAYYPEGQRSNESYLSKVIQTNQKEGFDPLNSSSPSTFGGAKFARQDFVKGPRYEAVLVGICKEQAMVFIFASSDRDGVNKLISTTQITLDPVRSGCDTRNLGAKEPSGRDR